MKSFHQKIKLKTKKLFDFIDLTDEIKEMTKKMKIKNGLFNIQSKHTTVAVVVNENEPLLISDIKKMLEKISPKKK